MPRIRIEMPEALADALSADADGAGVPLSDLVRTDLVRYRKLAEAATPSLTRWQWDLLSHVLSGVEAHDILSGFDALPSSGRVAAAIDALRAGELRQQVMGWPPLTIAGVLMRLRRG